MTDYLREVEESMRAEKFARLWTEHGRFIIMACVALVIGTAGQSAWTAYQDKQNEKATSLFLDATKGDDPLPALQKLGKSSQSGDAALASLYAGNMLAAKQDWAGALASYKAASDDRHAPAAYRDLAIVQYVALQLDHDSKASNEDMLKALAPLMDSKKSIWWARATLLSAIIKGDKQKNYSEAVATLKPLTADTSLPNGFAAQISALVDVYSLKGSTK